MSSLIVEVSKLDDVKPHPNADSLELGIIKGWQCVIPKGKYRPGSRVVYIPVDSVLPVELSDRIGITKYLSNGRVRCAKLRGEPSFGVVMELEDAAWPEGLDVRERYGITKYLPPIRPCAGDAEAPHPLFCSYTDVENLRNFPDVPVSGERVFATEKIHGTNCRVGIIEGEEMAGSMEVRRKRPAADQMGRSIYWMPFAVPGVIEMLRAFAGHHRQVILFGEVYGSKIQNLHYGRKGHFGFAAFDMLIDGKYLDQTNFFFQCRQFGVPHAPLLFDGPFSLDAIREVASGQTVLGADHIREGVVVRPATERTDPKTGRVCLKYISDEYLLSKGISDTNDI